MNKASASDQVDEDGKPLTILVAQGRMMLCRLEHKCTAMSNRHLRYVPVSRLFPLWSVRVGSWSFGPPCVHAILLAVLGPLREQVQ
jgi:hypothetical protein